MDAVIVSCILLGAIVLLITEIIPMDLTAIGIMTALMATGVLSPEEALKGLASPAVVTIAAMFMMSRGLIRTGALGFVSQKLIDYSKGSERRILLFIMIGVALPSAFMNNTPVVILFITIIMSVCCEYGLSPSKFLIPASYSSILGGVCTLIGTSTNLIVSDLSNKYGYGGLGMFELTPVGLVIALAVMTYLLLAAPRLLPQHKAPVCELKSSDTPRYLAELLVPAGSELIGEEPAAFLAAKHPEIELFEVIRGPHILFPEGGRIRIAENDLLLVKGSAAELVSILNGKRVELPHAGEGFDSATRKGSVLIVELVVTPQCRYLGEHPLESGVQAALGIEIIAVKRQGLHYADQKIRYLRLTIGDVLLVHCPVERLDPVRAQGDFIMLEDVHHRMIDRRKAPIAVMLFLAMVLSATLLAVDIVLCATAAVFLMVLTGCLQLRDAYRALDTKVLLLIAGMLALGSAMDKSGAARTFAELFLRPFQGSSPALILAAFILMTIVATELMSNAAVAVLLMPVAVSTALTLGVSPKPFIMGICFGASCSFSLPFGYQTNLLVYGPGGYRLTDYLKLGIPAGLMAWLISTAMIPRLWPF